MNTQDGVNSGFLGRHRWPPQSATLHHHYREGTGFLRRRRLKERNGMSAEAWQDQHLLSIRAFRAFIAFPGRSSGGSTRCLPGVADVAVLRLR